MLPGRPPIRRLPRNGAGVTWLSPVVAKQHCQLQLSTRLWQPDVLRCQVLDSVLVGFLSAPSLMPNNV